MAGDAVVVGAISGIGMTSRRTRQRLVQRLREAGIRDERVLVRILETPRHLFVDEALSHRAYEDTALPIGFGQTISQPYIVARMSEAILEDGRPEKVLEIGTGSAYQTAILAPLVGQVYSVERVARLLDRARERLQLLGIHNVRLKHGDGYQGWPYYAPYDAIIVTAAPETLPATLLEQLAEGGKLVAPVGPSHFQELLVVERHGAEFRQRTLCAVSFVPMLGGVL